ncbi:outer membrane beta-barrel protein [Hymenobacter sp. UYP22]|uniref:outer membrane beta-barrel protein n=1 Tax=Hymenobacter sp. UYP22 TaxID=3156348 RepID=UPI00339A9550
MYRSFALATGLSILALSAEAQIAQGTKLLGGSVGYNRSTTTWNNSAAPVAQREYEQTSRSFNVSPQAGVFIADNLAAGVSIGYSSQKTTTPYYNYSSSSNPEVYQQTARSNTFSVAPYLRYYYMPTTAFGVFGHLSVNYNTSKSQTATTGPDQLDNSGRSNGFGIGITPTLVFFPIEKLGLELSFGGIGYGRSTSKLDATRTQAESKATSSSFGAGFGLNQLSLGASYYLGR